MTRERQIYRVTLAGSIVNVALVALKFLLGTIGRSSAMMADAVHSLSDLMTDAIVVVFVRLGSKPQDADHDYGHGKYETMAASMVGLGLLVAGMVIFYSGAVKVSMALKGAPPERPGAVALVAAVLSIVLKEFAYRFTARAGRRLDSRALVANAWHHRSDALSSIGTAIGIAGAIFLGEGWTVLDPLAAIVVSAFVVRSAWRILRQASDELMEKSLSEDVKRQIRAIVESEPGVSKVHHLRTRRIGGAIAMEMHVRMPGDISLFEAHRRASEVEALLRAHFGGGTYIILHVEPLKEHGTYVDPGDR